MVPTHGVYSDPDPLSQVRLSLTFVAFFLFFRDRDDQLALIKAASRAYAVRNMLGPALGTLRQPRKLQALPVSASRVASCGGMMFFLDLP